MTVLCGAVGTLVSANVAEANATNLVTYTFTTNYAPVFQPALAGVPYTYRQQRVDDFVNQKFISGNTAVMTQAEGDALNTASAGSYVPWVQP